MVNMHLPTSIDRYLMAVTSSSTTPLSCLTSPGLSYPFPVAPFPIYSLTSNYPSYNPTSAPHLHSSRATYPSPLPCYAWCMPTMVLLLQWTSHPHKYQPPGTPSRHLSLSQIQPPCSLPPSPPPTPAPTHDCVLSPKV